MLDILEKILIRKGYSFSRLDGSTPTNLRQSLVDHFNSSPSKLVFLISTRAGGLGLNLVSANRVVIFDPNWNPAQDLQAQDRSFRFGQKRHVVVFLLLAGGSFEELVYSRQVYKQQLSNIAVSGKMESRYFVGVQDCKQFQGEIFGICNLFRDLSDKLFTSEIIEMHENRGQDDGCCSTAKQELPDLRNHFLPPKQTDATISLCSETEPSDHGGATTTKPVLEELGILYAHRNEDIINVGPNSKRKMVECIPQEAASEAAAPLKRRRPGDKGGIESGSSSKDWKRIQFSRLAESMGLSELSLSKWYPATPSEREYVLQDYRKRKENIPNG